MTCTNCNKNTAITRIVRTINGTSREYYLCKFCADSLNFSPNLINFLPGDLLKSIAKNIGINTAAPQQQCTFCKSTFDKIAAQGVMGCAECYNTFKSQLAPYLSRIHPKILHIGKMPKSAGAKISKKRTLNDLKSQLKSAIDVQNFEQAAILRDKINAIETDENGGSA